MPNPYTRFTVHVPVGTTGAERLEIGQRVIDEVVNRTRNQYKDKNGKPFPKYSKEYKGSLDFQNFKSGSNVDLTLTGDMLDTLEILTHGEGYIDIGYHDGSAESGKVEGNVRGTYGQGSPIPGKKRDFLGIDKAKLQKIIDEVVEAPIEKKAAFEFVAKDTTQKEINAILAEAGIESPGYED